jgi:transcription antitermination factor NusG
MAVLSTPAVNSIVSIGGVAAPIADEEVESIRTIIASGHPVVAWPYLPAGLQVRVTTGCLEGLVGTVVREKSLCRVVVNVVLLQRSVAVEIDREDLLPAPLAVAS